MLELAGVWAGYGPVRALAGVTLSVAEGTTVALLGRNGAGKTTTLRVASAMIRPQRGEVSFDGRPVRDLWTEDLVAAGLVHVPEGRGLFPHMSVGENLELGAHSARLSRRTAQARIADVLDYFPYLSDKLNRRTSTLSGGEQQMTAMARALMARPRLLLLDEPSLGLSPVVTQALYALLARLKREGLSMLLVEQYAELAAGIADRVYLLDKGHVAASGPPADVLAGEILEHTYMAHTTEAM